MIYQDTALTGVAGPVTFETRRAKNLVVTVKQAKPPPVVRGNNM